MTDTTCPTCGSPVKVVGHTTMHYEPIHAHESNYSGVLALYDKEKQKSEKLLETLKEVQDAIHHEFCTSEHDEGCKEISKAIEEYEKNEGMNDK